MNLLLVRLINKQPQYDEWSKAFYLRNAIGNYHTDSDFIPSWYSTINGNYFFCFDGLYHNLRGPAFINCQSGIGHYCVMGKEFNSKEEWQEAVKRFKNESNKS